MHGCVDTHPTDRSPLPHLWLHASVLRLVAQVRPQRLEGPLAQCHPSIVKLLNLDQQLNALQLLLGTLHVHTHSGGERSVERNTRAQLLWHASRRQGCCHNWAP